MHASSRRAGRPRYREAAPFSVDLQRRRHRVDAVAAPVNPE
jgi:hypothetical protein